MTAVIYNTIEEKREARKQMHELMETKRKEVLEKMNASDGQK